MSQDEFIALCKTLYALLQDSADEEGLFQAMNRVAYKLLEMGRDNSERSSVAELSRVSETHSETTFGSGDENECAERSSGSDTHLGSLDKSGGETGSPQCDSPFFTERNSSKYVTMRALVQEDPLGKGSGFLQQTHSADLDNITSPKTPASDSSFEEAPVSCSSPLIASSHDGSTTENGNSLHDADDEAGNKAASLSYITATENLSLQALQGSDWFLTFEQFLSGLQLEPALCQFFAEQYMMDLIGTSVDPGLGAYTRAFMANNKRAK